MDDPPQVLISVTARFRRLSWKYGGLAYRLVMLHVGVLMQSLYLVCTAMRLAPCALGSVSIDVGGPGLRHRLARRAVRGPVRHRPRAGRVRPRYHLWRNVNDAGWADLAHHAVMTASGAAGATVTDLQQVANRQQSATQPVRSPAEPP